MSTADSALHAGASSAAPLDGAAQRFDFEWDPALTWAARMFGVSPNSAWVEIENGWLTAHFGPWLCRTPVDNVISAERTGPYQLWKVAGPAHLSLSDLGLTFATTAAAGVCIRFRRPVPGIDPVGAIRHPSLTVTVADVDRLVGVLGGDHNEASTRNGLRQQLTHGAVAGAAATAAMSGVMLAFQRVGAVDRTSPRVITERAVPVIARRRGRIAKGVSATSHLAFGTGAGAFFGLIRSRLPGPDWARGMTFATGILVASYEGWVPVAGLLPPLHRQSIGRKASLVLGHLCYGAVLGRIAGASDRPDSTTS